MMATIALVLIAVAVVLQIVFLLRKDAAQDPVSHYMLAVAFLLLAILIVQRSTVLRFPAVTTMYESLLFFSAILCAVVFALRMLLKTPVLRFILFGATVVALALLMVSSSPLAPRDIQPPLPALQSYWLVLHVTFAFIGEAFFTVSFAAAVSYLVNRNEEKAKDIDRVMYTTVGIGYPIFTAGALIFGAIWAQAAWGSYWSWDPKETWALITWLVYTAFLHTRLIRGLRGRMSAILAIAGFTCTIFTFFGVNYLLSGLHRYV